MLVRPSVAAHITANTLMASTLSATVANANNYPTHGNWVHPASQCNVIIQNVVATVTMLPAGAKLDLKDIALRARNAEYTPKRFAAVIMRIRAPKTTALVFSSGKMVVTGAKSEDDSRKAASIFIRIIKKLNYPTSMNEFKIQNMVASTDVKFPISLETMVIQHMKFACFEPELFPGLVYRLASPKVVLLVFVSGKVVLTGAKSRNDIYEAFEKMYPVLQAYQKRDA